MRRSKAAASNTCDAAEQQFFQDVEINGLDIIDRDKTRHIPAPHSPVVIELPI
jgi:hypothetical protein